MSRRTPVKSQDSQVDVGTSSSSDASAVKSTTTTRPSPFTTLFVPVVVGSAFGAVFQLSRVHEFSFIREQLLMRRFLMLKMFLSAAAVSITTLTLLPYVSRRARTRIASWSKVMSETISEGRGLPALIAGAASLGTGMAISGSCPGTVFAQVASGSVQARWIMLGAFTGACIYPIVDTAPGWNRLLQKGRARWQSLTLPQLLGAKSVASVALPLAASFATLVATLEYLSPWRDELAASGVSKADRTFPHAIPPYVAGAVVGSLQLPLILFVNNHLGCSSSYMTVVARLVGAISPRTCARLPLLESLRNNVWQVALMGGVALGAFVASTASGVTFASDALISPTEGVIGGALLVVGARLAAGCTSGHGISGMGYLALNSFVAVASMFIAGIATAFLFYRYSTLGVTIAATPR